FRTFLRTCVDRFVANEEKSAGRIKRGGNVQMLSLDFAMAEQELQLAAPTQSADECFDREWARSLFSLSVAELRKACAEQGKQAYFQLFECYDLANSAAERPTYRALAERFGIAQTDVTNYLAWARRELKQIVLARLRDVTAFDDEFHSEAGHLF